MTFDSIRFTVDAGIARLTLNRPEKLNSFNTKMHEEVATALAEVETSDTVRVLVLTGAGRGFCAGQDLSDRAVAAGDGIDLGASIEKYYAPLVRRLRNLPLPVVCGVNGVAAGAGANVAFACDIVVAARSATFIESFSKLGLVPDTGGTYFLPRLAGTARAMGMAMLGDKITAEQAENWGLIWKCFDDVAFPAAVDDLATKLAQAPTAGLARIKQAIYASSANTFDEQLALESKLMRQLGRSSDYREGVAAFLEKRTPQFTGR